MPVLTTWPDPLAAIGHVEAFSGPPPPLLVFAGALAEQVGGDLGAALRRWVSAVAGRLGVERASLRPARMHRDAVGPPGKVFLVVMLQPDGVDLDRYLLSVWTQRERQDRVLLRDDTPRTLAEVAEMLDGMLAEVHDEWARTSTS